jgi:hypothetical protein
MKKVQELITGVKINNPFATELLSRELVSSSPSCTPDRGEPKSRCLSISDNCVEMHVDMSYLRGVMWDIDWNSEFTTLNDILSHNDFSKAEIYLRANKITTSFNFAMYNGKYYTQNDSLEFALALLLALNDSQEMPIFQARVYQMSHS